MPQEPRHKLSITGAAAEAMRTGVAPSARKPGEIPGQDRVLRGGDPDVDPLDVEYSGEEVAGGGNSSPDQNNVDEIGRIAGISNTDDGELVLGDDLIRPRDEKRWELEVESKDPADEADED
jgi:hypothetical protein